MNNLFDDIGIFYDLLYQDKDNKSEVNYVDSIIKDFGNKGKTILEFGSGTGRHSLYFAELGYKIHGIEKSLSMVNASKKTKGFTCEQGDITKIKINSKFDNIISLFHVFSYLTNNSQVKELLINANHHLKERGLFIFDFWYSPAVISIKPEVRIKRFSNDQYSIIRIAEPEILVNENIVKVNYTFLIKKILTNENFTIKESHPMRHFSIPEIEFMCNETGFKLIKAEEWLTGNKPSESSWGVCLVIQKI